MPGLTQQQELAATTQSRRILVSAGAGSGKHTFSLNDISSGCDVILSFGRTIDRGNVYAQSSKRDAPTFEDPHERALRAEPGARA